MLRPAGLTLCLVVSAPLGGPCPPRHLLASLAVGSLTPTPDRTLLPTGPHTLCWLLSAASKHLMQPFL